MTLLLRVMTVAFIKRGTHVESTKQLTKQIQTIHLSQESTYESLHSLISSAIIPMFNSFVTKSGECFGDHVTSMYPLLNSVQKDQRF